MLDAPVAGRAEVRNRHALHRRLRQEKIANGRVGYLRELSNCLSVGRVASRSQSARRGKRWASCSGCRPARSRAHRNSAGLTSTRMFSPLGIITSFADRLSYRHADVGLSPDGWLAESIIPTSKAFCRFPMQSALGLSPDWRGSFKGGVQSEKTVYQRAVPPEAMEANSSCRGERAWDGIVTRISRSLRPV